MKPVMRRFFLIVTVVLAVVSAPGIRAQEADDAALADRLLADQFVRAAVSALAISQFEETNHPQKLAATLLDQSLELNSQNAEVWKFRAELARDMGNSEVWEQTLVGYLRTGVEDDQARYDLVTLRLAKHNTLDEQYRALDELLTSEAGRRLSNPLQSKLASFAASLAQELVEPANQARWVVHAVRLDPANAEAAEMLLALVLERGGDTLRQGTAMVTLIQADPLDPWNRLEIAGLLASEGAFTRSAQQFSVADRSISRSPVVLGETTLRELMPMSAYRTWSMCLATLGEDVVALQIISGVEEYLEAYHTGLAAAQSAGYDVSQAPQMPEQLPGELELVRLAVLDSPSDTDAAAEAFQRLEQLVGESEDQTLKTKLALVAAVFGPDLDHARELVQALPEDAEQRAVGLGWIALRGEDQTTARELLTPLEPTSALAACGLARISLGDDANRSRLLQQVITRAPASLASLAAGRMLVKDGRDVLPTRTGSALTDLMRKYPETLWQMDLDRSPWVNVRVVIEPARLGPLDDINARITIWNTLRMPISIGEEGVIKPRALVFIQPKVGGQAIMPMPPQVIDLTQKITLAPGERLVIETRLDYHAFGMLRQLNSNRLISFDARVVVNPLMGANGSFHPSDTGGDSTMRDCLIEGLPANEQRIEQWIADLDSNTLSTRLGAIARLAGLSRKSQLDVITRTLEQELQSVMSERFPDMAEVYQAWTIMHLIEADDSTATYHNLAALVQQSDSDLVWLAYLTKQVTDPESELLVEAISRQDMPVVSAFAQDHRRALRQLMLAQEEAERDQAERDQLLREQERLQPSGQ